MAIAAALFVLFATNNSVFAGTSEEKPFLRPVANSEIPLPIEKRIGSTFFAMNEARFAALSTWREFICTIPNIEIPGAGTYTLRVEQFDDVDGATIGEFAVPKHAFFRGSLDGVKESHVCFTFFDDNAWGYINIGEHSYIMSAAGRAPETGELIIGISEDTVQAAPINCGTKDWHIDAKSIDAKNLIMPQSAGAQAAPTPLSSNSIAQLRVGLEMDDSVVKLLGNTDTAALKYALSVIAAASDLYMRDANVALIVSEHKVWVGKDPYDKYTNATACDLLNYFTGKNLTGPKPSLFVLMSGRHTDWCGGVAADIAVLCQSGSNKCVLGIKGGFPKSGWMYPYNSWTWDAMVCAHETGHVVACAHTHNCSFYDSFGGNGPIDSCYQAEGGCFDQTVATRGTIMSYCHLTSSGAMLKFHPYCVNAIEHYIAEATQSGCAIEYPMISTNLSPGRYSQKCDTRPTFSINAYGGNGPYSFEINPAPANMIVSGNTCTFTLAPKKPSVYYIRVTDADTLRSYDSVVFVAGTFESSVAQDSSASTRDSVTLVANFSDPQNATCAWYQIPPFRPTMGWSYNVARPAAGDTAKYFAKIGAGQCSMQDTIVVVGTTLPPPPEGVAEYANIAMKLYPNPARDRVTLLLPSNGLAERVWIADALGREVVAPMTRSQLSLGDHSGEAIDFVISQLPAGAYWIVRELNGRTQSVAFEKQ